MLRFFHLLVCRFPGTSPCRTVRDPGPNPNHSVTSYTHTTGSDYSPVICPFNLYVIFYYRTLNWSLTYYDGT
ncbi:hypothetical protein GGR55DRAFT_648739 [Xylaria sp. FL0064]|nr:hypothetical protein GGR55DRAFT_648739 [Xylaria sp. FL0064]